MGKFKLDKAGVNKIRKMLCGQVANVEKKLACEAYDFFLNFGYHKEGSGIQDGGGGWTFYYLSNWNVTVNGADFSYTPDTRFSNDDYWNNVDREKAKRNTQDVQCGDSITVTNGVWYGGILNDGGVFPDGGNPENNMCEPNRFMEQCIDHIENITVKVIEQTAKECPEI